MILLSELSRRRIRSIQKLIRVGREEVVVCLRVDKEKGAWHCRSFLTKNIKTPSPADFRPLQTGYIDLSKRRVSPEDMLKAEDTYQKGKTVASIMRHVAGVTQTPMQTLYEHIGWPLNKRYGHAIDAFKLSITNPEVWKDIEFPSEAVRGELTSYISKRLTPQPTKIRADVEVICFGYEGIDAVKTALRKAEAHNTSDTQVKVKLVSPPLYVLTCQTLDKTVGIKVLEDAIEEVSATIQAAGGECKVRMAPKAVTENDDAELQKLMDTRARENQEVSGDEDESGSGSE